MDLTDFCNILANKLALLVPKQRQVHACADLEGGQLWKGLNHPLKIHIS